MAAELVIFDEDEDVAKTEAEDLAHAAVLLGCTKVHGTSGNFSSAYKYDPF